MKERGGRGGVGRGIEIWLAEEEPTDVMPIRIRFFFIGLSLSQHKYFFFS
jgi:hypothetical protein